MDMGVAINLAQIFLALSTAAPVFRTKSSVYIVLACFFAYFMVFSAAFYRFFAFTFAFDLVINLLLGWIYRREEQR